MPNIFIVSLIFTVIALIIVNIVLFDYSLEAKYQLKFFIYFYILCIFACNVHKRIILQEDKNSRNNNVTEVFKEINDNKDTVDHIGEPVKPLFTGNYELNIEPIPQILTNTK